MKKSWMLYAKHILDTIPKLQEIQAKGNILEDDILYAATLRHLQTMSESTQKLPTEKKNICPEIKWKQISGFRNYLVHSYLGDIDEDTVVSVIENDLQNLQLCVEKLLEEHGNEK